MNIDTIRFGRIEIEGKKIITCDTGFPGLESSKKYVILQFEESYPILWLQSLDESGVCLPVVDTFSLVPDYVFDIGDEDVKDLALDGPDDLHVMSVLVIPSNIEAMTVNLAAPIVINTRTGRARQILLSHGDYNVRFPIFEGICRLIREGEAADAGTVEKD